MPYHSSPFHLGFHAHYDFISRISHYENIYASDKKCRFAQCGNQYTSAIAALKLLAVSMADAPLHVPSQEPPYSVYDLV